MSTSFLVFLIVSAALSGLVSWVLLSPFLATAGGGDPVSADTQLLDLLGEKAVLVEALDELEQEKLTGRLSPEEYEKGKSQILAKAFEVVEKIESLRA